MNRAYSVDAVFERIPGADIAARARRYDDAGEAIGMVTAPLSRFQPLLERLIPRGR